MLAQTVSVILPPVQLGISSPWSLIGLVVFLVFVYILWTVLTGRTNNHATNELLELSTLTFGVIEDFLVNTFTGEQIQLGLGLFGEDVKDFANDTLLSVQPGGDDKHPTLMLIFKSLGVISLVVMVVGKGKSQEGESPTLFEWDDKDLTIIFDDEKLHKRKLVMKLATESEMELIERWDGDD